MGGNSEVNPGQCYRLEVVLFVYILQRFVVLVFVCIVLTDAKVADVCGELP